MAQMDRPTACPYLRGKRGVSCIAACGSVSRTTTFFRRVLLRRRLSLFLHQFKKKSLKSLVALQPPKNLALYRGGDELDHNTSFRLSWPMDALVRLQVEFCSINGTEPNNCRSCNESDSVGHRSRICQNDSGYGILLETTKNFIALLRRGVAVHLHDGIVL